jgi:hypothetical protein
MQRASFLLSCFVALTVQANALAEDSPIPNEGESSYSSENSDSHYRTSRQIPLETHNPDEKEQTRLRVKWDKAGVLVYDGKEQVVCDPDDRRALRPDRMLAIQGQLLIEAEDGRAASPIDWVQGVRVVISRTPQARPDWNERHLQRDSVWSDGVTTNDGRFFVIFQPDQIRRPVGRTGQFQIALSLGQKNGHTVSWKNSTPVLPQTVTTIELAGAKPISPTLQTINGAPSVREGDFNPTMLVRAVNHLHALGKERAIAELRNYLEIARQSSHVTRDPADIDTSNHQCVLLIVRLLFEPADPADKLPGLFIGAMSPSPPPEGKEQWPLFPLYVQEDIPFLLIRGTWGTGTPRHPSRTVDWAEKFGKLREKPLRPGDDPLSAADKLLATPQAQRLFQREADTELLRRQVWRMVRNLSGKPLDTKTFRPFPEYELHQDWETYEWIANKIRWNVDQQNYVVE